MATELPHGYWADSALMAASYSRRAEAWLTTDAAPESEAVIRTRIEVAQNLFSPI